MKRIIALLLAAVLALGLTGCGLNIPFLQHEEKKAEPTELGSINVINLIRNAEPISFPLDEEFADRRITRFQLSQALQEAAKNKRTVAEGEAAGLAMGKEGYWSRIYHMENASGDENDLWIELTCGITENLVRVTAYKGGEYGTVYLEGAELYSLLRHYRDKVSVVDEEVRERYKDVLGAAIEELYQDEVGNGQPYTGWEITRLEWLHSYTDPTDDSTINIYAVEYVMLTDMPDKVYWRDGMTLDSQGRVENVGDIGRLTTRYWWWGEKWESAVLGKTVPADELTEAREALNANNPRD